MRAWEEGIKRVQAHPEFNRFHFIDFSQWDTRRGVGFELTLTLDDDIIGEAWQDGCGGCDNVLFIGDNTPEAWTELEKATEQKCEPFAMVIEAILQGAGL